MLTCDTNILNQFQLTIASRRPGINRLEFSRSRFEYDSFPFGSGNARALSGSSKLYFRFKLMIGFAFRRDDSPPRVWSRALQRFISQSVLLPFCCRTGITLYHRPGAHGPRSHVEGTVRETRVRIHDSGSTCSCCQPRLT